MTDSKLEHQKIIHPLGSLSDGRDTSLIFCATGTLNKVVDCRPLQPGNISPSCCGSGPFIVFAFVVYLLGMKMLFYCGFLYLGDYFLFFHCSNMDFLHVKFTDSKHVEFC